MADDDQYNDEYQFSDLDEGTPSGSDESSLNQEGIQPEGSLSGVEQNTVKRNAIIVAVAFVCLILLYQLVGAMFSSGKKSDKLQPTATKPAAVLPKTVPMQPKITTPSPPLPLLQSSTSKINNDEKFQEKLIALEAGQQGMRSELDSIKAQLGTIDNNLTAFVSKLAELNTSITALGSKMDEISHEVELLALRREATKSHSRPPVRGARSTVHSVRYYLQAIIPGRAWLMAADGSTLTVREGTRIPAYGIVKLIDPSQGRVITSSGQVIKFSQEDS